MKVTTKDATAKRGQVLFNTNSVIHGQLVYLYDNHNLQIKSYHARQFEAAIMSLLQGFTLQGILLDGVQVQMFGSYHPTLVHQTRVYPQLQ
jgi:hypothetical protein